MDGAGRRDPRPGRPGHSLIAVRLAALLVGLAMVVVGLLLLLDVAYFVRGSLEWFPTDEQQDKIRRVTGAIAALLAGIEIGLWWLLRYLRRGGHPPRSRA